MKNLILFFALMLTFNLSAQKRISFECFDCRKIESKDCDVCKTSDVNKMYLNGILVRFDNAAPVALHKPFKVWTKGRSVYVKDFEGTQVRIPANKTVYNKLGDLVDAVLDCNCGSADTNTTYVTTQSEPDEDGIITYTTTGTDIDGNVVSTEIFTSVDTDTNTTYVITKEGPDADGTTTYTQTGYDIDGNVVSAETHLDTDTQLTPAELCISVAANCNATIGEITYTVNANGDNVANVPFTDNAGVTVIREIVFPPNAAGSTSSVTKVAQTDGSFIITHDDGTGNTEEWCDGITLFEDHHGIVKSNKTIQFDEDFYFNTLNEDDAGSDIGISGADYADANITGTTNHSRRGVVTSTNSNSLANRSTVVSSEASTASGDRSFIGGSRRALSSGVRSGQIGTEDTQTTGSMTFSGGGDNNLVSGLYAANISGQNNIDSGTNSTSVGSTGSTNDGVSSTSVGSTGAINSGVRNGAYSSWATLNEIGQNQTATSSTNTYAGGTQNNSHLASTATNIGTGSANVSFISSLGNNGAVANSATEGVITASSNVSAIAGNNVVGSTLSSVLIGGYNGLTLSNISRSRIGGISSTMDNINNSNIHVAESDVRNVAGTIGGGSRHNIDAAAGGLLFSGDQLTITGNSQNTATVGILHVMDGSPQSFSFGFGHTQVGVQSSGALGTRVTNTHTANISLSGNSVNGVASQTPNSMNTSFYGGHYFHTNVTNTLGVQLAGSGTAWATISDKNKKTNFQNVDDSVMLNWAAKQNVQKWQYKAHVNEKAYKTVKIEYDTIIQEIYTEIETIQIDVEKKEKVVTEKLIGYDAQGNEVKEKVESLVVVTKKERAKDSEGNLLFQKDVDGKVQPMFVDVPVTEKQKQEVQVEKIRDKKVKLTRFENVEVKNPNAEIQNIGFYAQDFHSSPLGLLGADPLAIDTGNGIGLNSYLIVSLTKKVLELESKLAELSK